MAQSELECAETPELVDFGAMQHSTEDRRAPDLDTQAAAPQSPISDSAAFIAEFALFPEIGICEPLQPIEQTTFGVEHTATPPAVEKAGLHHESAEAENTRSESEDSTTPDFFDAVDEQADSDLQSELPTTSFNETVVDELTEQPVESSQELDEPAVADLANVSEPAARSSQDDCSNSADHEDEDWTAEQPDENLLFVSTRCKNCRAYYRFRIAEKLQFACRECGELCVAKPSVAGRLKQWFGGRLKPKRRG